VTAMTCPLAVATVAPGTTMPAASRTSRGMGQGAGGGTRARTNRASKDGLIF
jgi:hypothetical protein